MSASRIAAFLASVLAWWPVLVLAQGYQPSVTVSGETRLDWVFALANQSLSQPPADWLTDYRSTDQRYELFVPPHLDRQKPASLVLFISAGAQPAGWKQFQELCQRSGVVFASAYDAGNDCPLRRRVRIVLDVLDDVRRQYPIDPDRTYLAGFSGGARVACAIAFALPEYFGGVLPVCAGEDLREESWLRQRVIDRLSVALVTGEQDFNRSELERFRGPFLTAIGVRTKVWVTPQSGHAIPGDAQLGEAWQWLEDGLSQRKKAAVKWPAMRLAADRPPSREEWSRLLLKEAELRLKQKPLVFSGLMQLQGLSTRWSDLPAAATARQILTDYDGRKARPWEADDVAEQRKFLIAQARALGDYATGSLPAQYEKQRTGMARGALELWQQVLDDGPQTPAGQEAKRRIPELEKLAEGK